MSPKQQVVLYVFIYVSLCRATVCLHTGYKKLARVWHSEWECASAAGVPAAVGGHPMTELGFLSCWGSSQPFRIIDSLLAVFPSFLGEVCSHLLLRFLPCCRNTLQMTDPAATPGEGNDLWGGWGHGQERSVGWVTAGSLLSKPLEQPLSPLGGGRAQMFRPASIHEPHLGVFMSQHPSGVCA